MIHRWNPNFRRSYNWVSIELSFSFQERISENVAKTIFVLVVSEALELSQSHVWHSFFLFFSVPMDIDKDWVAGSARSETEVLHWGFSCQQFFVSVFFDSFDWVIGIWIRQHITCLNPASKFPLLEVMEVAYATAMLAWWKYDLYN